MERKVKKKPVSKKKKKKDAKKVNQEDLLAKEMLGLFFIVFGIISFLSIFSIKMGIIGKILYKSYTFLFGTANFLMPILLIFWGLTYNIESMQKNTKRYFICSSIILLCITVILDGSKPFDLTLISRIQLAIEYSDVARSGGIIGAVLGFFIYKLFGSFGAYAILLILILASVFIMIRPHMESIKKGYNNVKSFSAKTKEKIDNGLEESKQKKETKETKKIAGSKKNVRFKEKIFKNKTEKSKKTEKFNEKNVIIKDYDSKKKSKKPKNEEIQEEVVMTNSDDTPISEDLDKAEKIKRNDYVFPPIELMDNVINSKSMSNKEIMENGKIIEETMDNFGIESKITAINKGPVITCYELEPEPGVKLSKIVALNDNLAMALASSDIRIEAPIPGKAAVGIEVPNKVKDAVSVREMIESAEFEKINSNLPLALGKDVSGEIIISEIDKMPHLLIAGATGSGKSVCINSILTSIIYKSSPDDVKLMLIDPKVVELSIYNGIPHLLIPVVTDAKKASLALSWAVGEMEKRYKMFAETSVRDIKSFNKKIEKNGNIEDKMPQIVVVVDELSDLMMVAAGEVEDYIARLAQMARAAGIHLIIATQRPSVDVITGTIKANIPSRIAFAVSSAIDSRTILDMAGAEKLLGRGDMLFYPSFYSKPKRVQGAFISDEEVERIVEFVKDNSEVKQEEEKAEEIIKEITKRANDIRNDLDPLFGDALKYILEDEQASISFLQRKLKIGYSRAARIVDAMEEMGVLGPHEGSKPRKIVMNEEEIKELLKEFGVE